MKKIITAMLLAAMILSFASCNDNNDTSDTSSGSTETTDTTATTDTSATTDTTETTETTDTTENVGGEDVTDTGAKAVLESVYGVFLDKLAPAFGAATGDEIKDYYVCTDTEEKVYVDEETGEEFSYEGPKAGVSAIDLSSEENALYMTYLPTDLAEKLESAAIFFNMQNGNTGGTFGAFELKDDADMQTIADALKDALANNFWMCGTPDRYLIVNVDGMIISAFGGTDPINAMKDAIVATYENAVVLYDEAIGF